jgi:hypothetical protein
MASQQTPQAPPRRRRPGPNWGLIAVFLGISVGLLILGALRLAGPAVKSTVHETRVETLASDGIDAMKGWQAYVGTEIKGEPTLTELEDGTIRLTAVYSGPVKIAPGDLAIHCQLLIESVPIPWEMTDCRQVPGRSDAYTVTIERK